MVKLYQKQKVIISSFLDGKSQRQIAKEQGINRETVATYIREYEKSVSILIGTENVREPPELIDKIVEAPKYNSENRTKRKLTDDIIEKIEEHLKENEIKRLNGQRKQMKKKIDIYEALLDENYEVGYGTVCNAINVLSNKQKEAFIKGEYRPGDVCEFDWGEVKLYINGELKKYQIAVFTSAYCNYRYARIYPKEDTLCFFEAHAMFFEHTGVYFRTMTYDNTRVVIKKFVGRFEKEPTEAILKLSLYYGFRFRFCNIYSGNEKGHVERSVEYIRRKAFAFKDKFETLEEANCYLLRVCDGLNLRNQKGNGNKTALEMFCDEQQHLLPRRPAFESSISGEYRVDKYSTISVNSCHYSVPDSYVGKKVFVKIYPTKLICYLDGDKVAEHSKQTGSNQWKIQIEHYLSTLKKKPGALANSVAFGQARPELKKIYSTHYIKKEKEFIELLQLLKESSVEKILKAVNILEKISPLDVSTEKIKSLIYTQHQSIYREISDSEINMNAKEMLKRFNVLIPIPDTRNEKEVVIQ